MPENKTLSTAKKLVQAAALAAILVPLGSVVVETSTITCGFSGGGCTFGGTTVSDTKAIFDFGPYAFELEFFGLNDALEVTVEDVLTNQGTLFGTGGRLASFGGWRCVSISPGTPATQCVDFKATLDPPPADPPPDPRWDFYEVGIRWDADTNAEFPDSPGGRIRILHSRLDGTTADITIPGSYDSSVPPPPCDVECLTALSDDPFIGGRDGDFSLFTVTQAPVPEPGTVLLVASGLTGLYYRRRRSRNTDASPRS